MRLLLGGLLLVVLFLAATLWQRSWTSAARAERSATRGEPSPTLSEVPQGWSRVVIGRPSGAQPYRAPGSQDASPESSIGSTTPSNVQPPAGATNQHDPQPAASRPSPGTSAGPVIVAAGQSLSTICRERYGSARSEIVQAVAKLNRLASADSVREGQTLDLPPLDQLLPKR